MHDHTHLFKQVPAGVRMARVGGVAQSVQGAADQLLVGCLKPGLVRSLRETRRDRVQHFHRVQCLEEKADMKQN